MKKVILSILLIVVGAIIGISWKASVDSQARCENKINNENQIENIDADLITKNDNTQKSSFTENKSIPDSPLNILKQYERGVVDLFQKSSSSVVFITTSTYQRYYGSRNIEEIPSGTGSGFVWDNQGHIITNYHVIKGAHKAEVTFADHTTLSATLVGISKEKDIAVLKVDLPKEKHIAIKKGISSGLKVGQFVMAIGNPFGLDHTLTTGVISALGREIQSQSKLPIRDIIQIDAAINPGNSGGPLLNSSGQLIGVNTAIYSPSGASAGIGFAIPIDVVKWVVNDIIKYGEVRRPVLGISVVYDYDARVYYGITKGVLISDVYEGSPSDKSGLRSTTRTRLGDIILGINNEKINSNADLILTLEKHKAGEKIQLDILRDGKEITVDLVLGISN